MNVNLVRGFTLLANLTAGCITLICINIAPAAGPGWASSFEQAVDQARKQQRPIFVDFSTSWCGVCKVMDRTVLADPTIIARLDNFVKVKVDGDVRADLCNQYGVKAYPTFIHLDPQGRILEKREGQMRTREMASALDKSIQSVVSTRAIAQPAAPQARPESRQELPPANQTRIASAENNNSNGNRLLRAVSSEQPYNLKTQPEGSREVADSEAGSDRPSSNAANELKGSVYAQGDSPRAENRSRFGGGDSALKELAKASAQPKNTDEKTKADEKKAEEAAKAELAAAEAAKKKAELAKAEEAEKAKLAKAEEAKKAEAASKAELAAAAPVEPKKELTLKAPVEVVSNDVKPPSIVQASLSRMSEEELPKPMLMRSAVNSTQAMNPTPAVSTAGAENKDVLSVIRKMQGSPEADKAGAEAPKAEVAAKQVELEKPVKKTVANLAPAKTIESSVKKSDDTDAKSTGAEAKKSGDAEVKTSTGASKADLARWMKDADTKLVDGRKKEARAMFSKVVENDPKNISGTADMAFIKMVSLIVDKDSDLQRREAYNKIRQFEARYPESAHKDYYTLIRAILAVDLGEINEAHRLLGPYPDRFPDSKYLKLALKTWKELPPAKKEKETATKSGSSSTKSGSSTSKSGSKSPNSSSSSKSSKSSADSSSKSSSKSTSKTSKS